MKKFKKLLSLLIASALLIVSCFSMAGCAEDITQIKLNVTVYNYEQTEEEVDIGFENVTLTIDLYGHFAPKTVENVTKYVKQGYYNNTVFYKQTNFTNQVMLGDFLVDGTSIKAQEKIMPQIKGEFERGGVSGSNLLAKKGSIGLWRTWYAYDGSYDTSNATMNSGRATWFIPVSDSDSALSGYNGWFCIFAQIDMDNEDNKHALDLISKSMTSGSVEKYVVYYTGKYDETQPDNNHGLTKHVVKESDFVETTSIFTANGSQEVCYNKHTITVPVASVNGETVIAAKVVSASIA